MKRKANELHQTAYPNPNPTTVATILASNTSNNPISSSKDSNDNNKSGGGGVEGGKVYQSIVKKLSMLKPLELLVEDESYKHAGHAGTYALHIALNENRSLSN